MKDVCNVFKMTNIQSLATEMLQIKHGQSLEIITDIFTLTAEQYNFRQYRDFRMPSLNAVYHMSESKSYLETKIWKIFPVKINEFNSPNSFKKEIKNWVLQYCPCTILIFLHKQYVSVVDVQLYFLYFSYSKLYYFITRLFYYQILTIFTLSFRYFDCALLTQISVLSLYDIATVAVKQQKREQ